MRCLNCQHDSPPDVRFCQECGKPLEVKPRLRITWGVSDWIVLVIIVGGFFFMLVYAYQNNIGQMREVVHDFLNRFR